MKFLRNFRLIGCVLLSLVFGAILPTPTASAEEPYQIEWIRQFGTSTLDLCSGLSYDGQNNIYLCGLTDGDLGGSNAGSSDAFLCKYDSTGFLQWTQQLGTADRELGYGVSADALGNIFISGSTSGDLEGTNAGNYDNFVCRYDSAGNLQWMRQFGTINADGSARVCADGQGNVLVSGTTLGNLGGTNVGNYDAFICKYDLDGDLLWTRQFGSKNEETIGSPAIDAWGNVYISGSTRGDLNGINAGYEDAYVSKYDSDGNLLWIQQLGTTGKESCYDVTVDGLGNVYICGSTYEVLGSDHNVDAFVTKFDSDGNLLWMEQFDSEDNDEFGGILVDSQNNIFVSGCTSYDPISMPMNNFDALVSKYDSMGSLLWTKSLSTAGYDLGSDIATDGLGNIFVSGHTSGNLGSINAGSWDGFVCKLSPVPEPGTLSLFTFGTIALLRKRRR